ncbi:MAG: hypothetical protein ABWY34_11370 [Pseudoxanthomonas sp.]
MAVKMGSSEKAEAVAAATAFTACTFFASAASAFAPLLCLSVLSAGLEAVFAVFFALRTVFMQAVALCL